MACLLAGSLPWNPRFSLVSQASAGRIRLRSEGGKHSDLLPSPTTLAPLRAALANGAPPGPEGPNTSPPAWATVPLLGDSIHAAAARVAVTVPPAGAFPERTLRWGTRVDVQPIGELGHEDLTEQAVASYVAKYATKAGETTGTIDRRIGERAELDKLPALPGHTRRLIEACWNLDAAYLERLLAHWPHMLGFRGHFSTKSRRYSTTLGALRLTRADYRARRDRAMRRLPEDLEDAESSTLVIAHRVARLEGGTGPSTVAKSYALLRAVLMTAVDDPVDPAKPLGQGGQQCTDP
ncbi:replication initiator [Streptomyces sp. NPDC055107]